MGLDRRTLADVLLVALKAPRAEPRRLDPHLRAVWLTDVRRSFDRLAQMAVEHLDRDPESGHLYLFFNCCRDCVKMLLWEGDGFVICYEQPDAGAFVVPTAVAPRSAGARIHARDLNLLLAGADPGRATRRQRFERFSARGGAFRRP